MKPAEERNSSARRPKFDDYADRYESDHARSVAVSGEPTEYFARYKLDCLLRLGLDRSEPILDYGCGVGNLTEQLVGHFTEVHAFDPSPKSCDVARRRAPGAAFHKEPGQLPMRHFRAVVLSGVLHHVPRSERETVLESVRATLAPGGELIVFEHNPLNPFTRWIVHQCSFDDDAVLLWPREARALVRRAGFSRCDVHYIFFFPHALAWLRRWEARLAWLPAGAQWMMVASA